MACLYVIHADNSEYRPPAPYLEISEGGAINLIGGGKTIRYPVQDGMVYDQPVDVFVEHLMHEGVDSLVVRHTPWLMADAFQLNKLACRYPVRHIEK